MLFLFIFLLKLIFAHRKFATGQTKTLPHNRTLCSIANFAMLNAHKVVMNLLTQAKNVQTLIVDCTHAYHELKVMYLHVHPSPGIQNGGS